MLLENLPAEDETPVAAPDAIPAEENFAVPQRQEIAESGAPAQDASDEVEEVEEIEHEGQRFKVPKALTPLLMMNADYTRKTMDLAAQRKAFEAERESLVKTSNDELNAFASVRAMQAQIGRFQNVDWNALNDASPAEAQKAFIHYHDLKDRLQSELTRLSDLRQQRISSQQQETARRLEEGRAKLTAEMGWNDTLKANLLEFAQECGFDRDELSDIESDPRLVRVLNEAFKGREATRQAQAAQRHVLAQQVEPAPTVKARSAPPAGLDDRLSTEEWMRRRNAQLRKRS